MPTSTYLLAIVLTKIVDMILLDLYYSSAHQVAFSNDDKSDIRRSLLHKRVRSGGFSIDTSHAQQPL